ncbi:MAG: manganese efflux pump [Proteobacteria bacterium]|jgi:manganese efflux pump family protein|nr:manganese efflux pump [Pseudomonadota bacterium]
MPLFHIIAIAVALSIDAFTVAVATGLTLGSTNARQTFRMSFHFGLFQALMPVLGWFAGGRLRPYIEAYDHWFAFALLALVAAKMFKDTLWPGQDENQSNDPTRGWTLVLLAVATSIDALAVGLSLAMLKVDVWLPALVIGLVAAACTAMGLHLGRLFGGIKVLTRWSSLVGACVLIAIGLHILWEHGVF